MSPVNAELAKLAIHAYVTTKISFANLLAEICEQLPGGDVDAVTAALGLLRDPARAEELGRAARRTAEERLSWARVTDELEGFYGRVKGG
jgi:glycosyltransferase involved in cell wall biosynthesis